MKDCNTLLQEASADPDFAMCDVKSVFPLRLTKFENIEVFVPNDSETILTKRYGDYMSFPESFGHGSIFLNFSDAEIDAAIEELQTLVMNY